MVNMANEVSTHRFTTRLADFPAVKVSSTFSKKMRSTVWLILKILPANSTLQGKTCIHQTSTARNLLVYCPEIKNVHLKQNTVLRNHHPTYGVQLRGCALASNAKFIRKLQSNTHELYSDFLTRKSKRWLATTSVNSNYIKMTQSAVWTIHAKKHCPLYLII